MKKILTPFLLLILHTALEAQTDSSILSYFPLQTGNLWQYTIRTSHLGPGYLQNMVAYADSTMPNGQRYTRAENAPFADGIKYYRIDSTYKVQEFYTEVGDTCGGFMKEVNFFRLNEPDSSVWRICFNVGDDLLFPFQLRYLGTSTILVFGQQWNMKLFRRYQRRILFGDTSDFYGKRFILMKGIGIYYTEMGEDGSATLEGAIVNGVKYGKVVGVANGGNNSTPGFSLYQNYPNPFNSETMVTFALDRSQFINIVVYNTLGQLIKVLENGVVGPGTHVRILNGKDIPSGLYYLRLVSKQQYAVKKILCIK